MVHKNQRILWRQPDLTKECGNDGNQLGVSGGCAISDHVDIPLEEFSGTPFLRSFVTPKWTKRPPSQWEGQLVLALGDHSGKGRSEFWTERYHITPPIFKDVGLLFNEFISRFSGIEFDRFQEWAVVFLITKGFRNLAYGRIKPRSYGHYFRVIVTCAF